MVADTLVRFDHGSGTATVLAGDADEIAERLGRDLVLQQHKLTLNRATKRGERDLVLNQHKLSSVRRSPEQAEYEDGVRRIKELIRAGDAFQVVLSQRAERATAATALDLYRALRRVNPSPYLFLLELGDLALIGSSPETLVKCEDGRASLNPIAGTTHPGEGDAERLLASDKDRAEHVMLVDLGRNDLSRVCAPGTVHVQRFLEPERFSHVTHLVSEVTGELRPGVTPVRPPARVLPGGDGLGRAQGARDADRLGARAATAAARTPARSDTCSRAARWTRASRSGRSSSPTASRGSRQARGSWQTPIQTPSTASA